MRANSLFAFATLSVLASMALAQEPVKPGPEHAHFKQFEGVWNASMKIVVGPDAPAQESKGTMTYKLDLGGLWLISDFRSDDFSGHGVSGYDPEKKKYSGIWVDSMGPAMLRIEGTLDKSGKVMTEFAEGPGPDGKPAKYKMVTQVKDKDAHVFSMSIVADGKEQPMLTIDYKRKK